MRSDIILLTPVSTFQEQPVLLDISIITFAVEIIFCKIWAHTDFSCGSPNEKANFDQYHYLITIPLIQWKKLLFSSLKSITSFEFDIFHAFSKSWIYFVQLVGVGSVISMQVCQTRPISTQNHNFHSSLTHRVSLVHHSHPIWCPVILFQSHFCFEAEH